MNRPNFFIVGAPKCGTTALHEYLRPHPQIVMSDHKEPHYFASDFHGPRLERFRTLDKYLALFKSSKPALRFGESSTYYLYSQRAAQEIHVFEPDAHIVIMLRSPVDTMYSLYFQYMVTRQERLETFEEALAAEADRKQGKRLPPRLNMMVEGLYYRDVVRFAPQVERYFNVFGRDRVHVIIYDDFRADTAGSYRQTLEFLNVDPNFTPDFKVVNAHKKYRNARVQDFLMNPPTWVMTVGHVVEPIARPLYWRLRDLNSDRAPKVPLNPELEKQLKQEFLPEVERLSALLDRDLTHWCAL